VDNYSISSLRIASAENSVSSRLLYSLVKPGL